MNPKPDACFRIVGGIPEFIDFVNQHIHFLLCLVELYPLFSLVVFVNSFPQHPEWVLLLELRVGDLLILDA